MGRSQNILLRALRRSMGTSLLVLTCMAGLALWALWVQGLSLKGLVLETLPEIKALTEVRNSVDRFEIALLGYIGGLTDGPDETRAAVDGMEVAVRRLTPVRAEPLEVAIGSLARELDGYETADAAEDLDASFAALERLKDHSSALKAATSQQVESVFQVSGALDALAAARRHQVWVVVALALGWVWFAVSFLFLIRRLDAPLRGLLEYLGATARRDLTRSLETGSRDEMGTVAAAVQGVTASLVGALRSMQTVSGKIATQGRELVSSAEHTRQGGEDQVARVDAGAVKARDIEGSIEPLSALSGQMRAGAERSAASVQQILASSQQVRAEMDGLCNRVVSSNQAMVGLNNGTAQVASLTTQLGVAAESVGTSAAAIDQATGALCSGASEGRELAADVADKASAGTRSMGLALVGMEAIRTAVNDAVGQFQSLEDGFLQVGDVTKIIDNIAGRTNLLSLNAAIIAAQAGEHGKAFGVVASEIRSLAESTAASTRQIRAIVEGVVEGGRSAAVAVAQGAELVEAGTLQMQETGDLLSVIHESAGGAASRLQEIEKAGLGQAEEAARVVEEIRQVGRGVAEIVALMQSQEERTRAVHADLVEIENSARQTALATEEQTKVTEIITHNVVEVSRASEQVDDAIAQVSSLLSGLREDLDALGARAREDLDRVARLEVRGDGLASLAGEIRVEVETFQLPDQSGGGD